MRKAAEPPYDVGMDFREFEVFRVIDATKQFDASLLIGELFRMHEGQVEKFKKRRLDALVDAAGEGTAGDIASHRVGCKSLRRAAKHVARKLVEDNDERQHAVVGSLP